MQEIFRFSKFNTIELRFSPSWHLACQLWSWEDRPRVGKANNE